MEASVIHIIYHPAVNGYAGYSKELDGLNTEGKTLEELFEKTRHLIQIRIKSLIELGKEKEAEELKAKKIVFVES
ncbi:MAG: hypothetical protein Q4G16_08270 [Cruoricaptor ignavus]|nr:hypothetical protein [Cruoricaptor ignavus]